MKQAVLDQPGDIVVREVEDPAPDDGEVVVEVKACGICGTDRAIYRDEYPIDCPAVLGHEFSGTIVAAGKDSSLQPGQRVSIDPNVTCGQCDFCRRGLTHLCANLIGIGVHRPGGFSEYTTVPVQNAYPIQAALSFESAAFAEPLACCIQGIKLAGIQLGDIAVVIGGGPIGCMLLQLCRLSGATVIVSEHRPARRELASALGAEYVVGEDEALEEAVSRLTNGIGADVVFEAAGRTAAAELAIGLARRGGTVIWFGAPPPGEDVKVSPFMINDSEITIRGSYNNPFTHAQALTLLTTGKVAVDALTSPSIQLERLPRALDGSEFREYGKVIVSPAPQTTI
jgi:L-iditol 2-dehydrogenase